MNARGPARTLAVLAVMAALAFPGAQQREPRSTRLALLVGINDYPPETYEDTDLRPLLGAENDVASVAKLLVERFAFPPDGIRVLRGSDATHRRIVTEFHDWLIRNAGPETEVLFWFSGHGSRVPDDSNAEGREPGWKESSFLAWDSRKGHRPGAFDIVDDELHSLLQVLATKTARITVVTDCCHSGGGVRGASGVVRGGGHGTEPLDRELLKGFWPESVPLLDDDDRRRRPLPPRRCMCVRPVGARVARREWPGARRAHVLPGPRAQ